jgi:hypothetical protein
MKTNSELQSELDSALRAVTSLAAQRNDLATLVKRLVREIRLVNRTDALDRGAMDYLVRNHLDGDPMRGATTVENPVANICDMVDSSPKSAADHADDLETMVSVLKNHRDQVRWEKREKLAHALDAGLIAIAAMREGAK